MTAPAARKFKTAAVDLIITGRCTGQCLLAIDNDCDCRCRGRYHGVLIDAPVDSTRLRVVPQFEPPDDVTDAWLSGGPVAARVAQGLSRKEAARRSGIDPSQLRRIEQGRETFSVAALSRYARAIGLPELSRLLGPLAKEPS